jgi:hypothetical protein
VTGEHGRTARDRDDRGRPRSARPRDSSGRPLPRDAPGAVPAPPAPATDAAALRLAQQLVDDERPFAAHEVLEEVWRRTTGPDRELWRGLAQLAVGLTHLQRGNVRGGRELLRRGARRIREAAAGRSSWPVGPGLAVPVGALAASALDLAEDPPTGDTPKLVLAEAPGAGRPL